jgi:hypothetical protein
MDDELVGICTSIEEYCRFDEVEKYEDSFGGKEKA